MLSYLKKQFNKKHKPVGGVKVILQHSLILKKLGYNVKLIKLGKYEGDFFNFEVDFCDFNSSSLYLPEDSIVVIPECGPGYKHYFDRFCKILYAQNTRIYSGVTHSYFNLNKNFSENGFVKTIA